LLKTFVTWDFSRQRVWVFIMLVAILKAILGEGGKRVTARANNRSMYKWRYYMPLGIGYSYALLVGYFTGPLVKIFNAHQMYSELGTVVPPQLFFFSASPTGIVLAVIGIMAVIEMEVGLTVLTGLSRNRGLLGYWFGAIGLSWISAFLLLYPWPNDWIRLGLSVGILCFGWVLIVKNRDAFRRYIAHQKTVRSFN